MRASVVAFFCAVAACGSAGSSDSGGNYTVRLEDGSYDFYAGDAQAIQAIASGDVADEHSPFVFYRLRAPAQAVESAFSRTPKKVFTVSLEESHPDFEVVVHLPASASIDGTVRHIVKRPGDPWTTGVAQIYFPISNQTSISDSPAVGMFDLTVYRPAGTSSFKTLSTESYRNGRTEDPAMPELKYPPERMDSWPPLPQNWN
jgi:hypothetical protein